MPMMSDAEVRQLANTLTAYEAREERAKIEKKKAKETERSRTAKLLGIASAAAGGALVGMWHGRREDADGNLFIPQTMLPADIVLGLIGSGAAFFMGKGLGGEIMQEGANGFLAAALAIHIRKHTAAGKAQNKFWAGIPELMGPITHNAPSIGAVSQAYLPVAQSMTDAELAASLRRQL